MDQQLKGSCLCGRVKFVVSGPFQEFHWCHCSRCRKDTGSAHASNIFARPDSVEWLSGRDRVKRFDLPEAERFAKAFCTECGSPVPYVNRSGTYLIVPAGSVDEAPDIVPDDHIHWRSRAPWYDAGINAVKYDNEPDD